MCDMFHELLIDCDEFVCGVQFVYPRYIAENAPHLGHGYSHSRLSLAEEHRRPWVYDIVSVKYLAPSGTRMALCNLTHNADHVCHGRIILASKDTMYRAPSVGQKLLLTRPGTTKTNSHVMHLDRPM